MTIKLPKPNLADKFLSWFGKKRAVHIPPEVDEQLGPYVYAQAEKESFWRAFLRPKHKDPPDGWLKNRNKET